VTVDDHAEIDRLWSRYKETDDPSVRDQLIVHYSPLVKYVAGRVAVATAGFAAMLNMYAPQAVLPLLANECWCWAVLRCAEPQRGARATRGGLDRASRDSQT
jgi:hypothetical protein